MTFHTKGRNVGLVRHWPSDKQFHAICGAVSQYDRNTALTTVPSDVSCDTCRRLMPKSPRVTIDGRLLPVKR